jgi:Tetraspanin family.
MYCFQFAVFLLVILIVEIAIGIVAFVKRDDGSLDRALNESISEIFANYTTDENARNEVDKLQHDVSQCCLLKKYGPIFISINKGYPVQLLVLIKVCYNVMMQCLFMCHRHAVMYVRQLHICFD